MKQWQQPTGELTPANSIFDSGTEEDESGFCPAAAVLKLVNASQCYLNWKEGEIDE